MPAKTKADELKGVFLACRRYFLVALLFSLAINLLYLSSPLYMLQVYDRVISSASQVTLVMLTILLLVALVALTSLDSIRARILTRASIRLDRLLAGRIVTATVESAVKGVGARSQPLRDFDTFRQFITGSGIHALFDLPWAPIYIGVIFILHPWLGAFAFGCAIILVLMALLNEHLVKGPLSEANEAASRNYGFTDMSLRNAEVVQAMGMMPGLLHRWSRDRNLLLDRQTQASDRAATTSSMIRFLRLAMQSLILALGAYLVIERMTTTGTMFAASILLGRALAPVEQMVGSWRGLTSARAAYNRVRQLLAANPLRDASLALPKPLGRLSVEALTYVIPGTNRAVLRNVNFRIEPGEVLGIIGPSGAGKSTLARQIVGILSPTSGAVRLDGADVAPWPRESLGRHLGYLPQDIELFADTVSSNISRFRNDNDQEVVEAAQLAGVHEMVLRLPSGYETPVGENGAILSGGYRQRIGLARAAYGNPSLVVLDEPSSNLDSDGDVALLSCITELKKRGTTVVMISHRPNTLGVADKLLVLKDGSAEMFGSRDEIIARLTRPGTVQTMPAKATAR
ncbi:type I secretion system permease/ATPase [Rhodoplanes sp. Z2-YC6860]|uniref:type I secretion system permease/ATPase n=1 Tax=Rhodoplanes sp. Z2-YC6860 TaxID=674703 RepID=UPI00078EB2C4|nr:type I secretion system permease/ATPase [Rhodoplanes sp. Z2-YC6860]AMN43727.1 type I secretion system ABC transporter, PrtD family [Rhodoplanes sp. Z2-YC6860]